MDRPDPAGPRYPGLEQDLQTARRLEWWSIAYICSCVLLLALSMGGSQALWTEVVEDGLSLFAPVLFLAVDPIAARRADARYPFGYERASSAGYLGAALALLATGLVLFGESAIKLATAEHPIIGKVSLFGHVVWIGWLAIPVLVWCAIPSWLLGRRKTRLARNINDKGLLADARTNAANWHSAVAAIVGILGVAAGWWWADATAALFISVQVIRSGYSELSTALADLMDRRPQKFGESEHDPVPQKLDRFLREQDWVQDAVVRVREQGRELRALAVVVPKEEKDLVARIDSAAAAARNLDMRLAEFVIMPTKALSPELRALRSAD